MEVVWPSLTSHRKLVSIVSLNLPQGLEPGVLSQSIGSSISGKPWLIAERSLCPSCGVLSPGHSFFVDRQVNLISLAKTIIE